MVVDRINRGLLKLIRRRSNASSGDIHIDANGISVVAAADTVWAMLWSDIQRIAVFRTVGFVGDDLVLAIESRASETHLVHEGQNGWNTLTAALPLHLTGAEPYESWALRVAFDADTKPIAVFERR